jgi:hypothetical protein
MLRRGEARRHAGCYQKFALPGVPSGPTSAQHGVVALADDDDGFAGRYDPSSEDLLHVVVPDDIRELDAEVQAYRRELDAARRHERRQRWRHRVTPRWARGGLPSPIFTAVLLVIATTGLLLSVFAPVTQERQHSTPISSLAHPKVPPGKVGGLLPDVQLLVDDANPINTRAVRPAVFILVPAGCQCVTQIRSVVGQANEVPPAPYVVIVSAGNDTTSAKLASAVDDGRGDPTGVRDQNGVLARTYHASTTAPTLLLVEGNGVLAPGSPHVFHTGDRIEDSLAPLHF